jgi:DNA-directed RNA polymerase subunit E'/Rpb7
MFVIVVMSDTLRIPPSDFDLPESEVLKFQINKKFANKVKNNIKNKLYVFFS